jgi:hypothetical protein
MKSINYKKFNLKTLLILKGIFINCIESIDNFSGSSLFKGGGPACGGFALKKNSARRYIIYYLDTIGISVNLRLK